MQNLLLHYRKNVGPKGTTLGYTPEWFQMDGKKYPWGGSEWRAVRERKVRVKDTHETTWEFEVVFELL